VSAMRMDLSLSIDQIIVDCILALINQLLTAGYPVLHTPMAVEELGGW
jgi:hypothetical protein